MKINITINNTTKVIMSESKLKSSIVLRMFIIAVLTLVLLIPTVFVDLLITDRSSRRESAQLEVNQSWGRMQTLVGPILTIPYKEHATDGKGGVLTTIRNAHFLPANLTIKGTLNPEIRYRGIYEVVLYNAPLLIEGKFTSPDVAKLRLNPDDVLWNEAFVTFGISDLKGIRDSINLRWNSERYPSEPGVLSSDITNSGVTFKPLLDTTQSSYSFSIPVNLNGSSGINFTPVGEITTVSLDAPWDTPSFIGSFLPHVRDVNDKNFHAEWTVLNLNRNFPQSWVGARYNLDGSEFGVSLILPVDDYQKISRSVKYALLFIALTFVAFFLSELMMKINFHPIQYALVGFALVLFYVLLISLTEHLRFNAAYIISSLSVIGLITVYAFWISKGKRIAVVIFLTLTALYKFLYVTLQLQDYALLMGSIGLFLVLFIIMYITRKIDWFSMNRSE